MENVATVWKNKFSIKYCNSNLSTYTGGSWGEANNYRALASHITVTGS